MLKLGDNSSARTADWWQMADDFLVLTEAPPSQAQRIVALGVLPTVLLAVFLLVRPFAGSQLPTVPAFVPFYATALFAINVVSAVILFSQFSTMRTRALLVVANGYLFAALILIPYTLAFPGLFRPDLSLIGGLQTTSWLYIFRHCGLAASLGAFALLNRHPNLACDERHVRKTIVASIAVTAMAVAALTVLSVADIGLLPKTAADRLRFGANWGLYAGLPISTLYGAALILLWPQRGTVLGLWLGVVALVHLVGVPLAFFPTPASRFSIGWYAVVTVNLVADSLVLIVLLMEISNLYARVLLAVRAQRRERDARLITGDAVAAMIAHEVKQPLAAIIIRARTSLRRLERPAPDLEKTKDEIQRIVTDGHRAAEIIDSVRANFKRDDRARMVVDVNSLVNETVALVRRELRKSRVELQIDPGSGASIVACDRLQLQQVLLNLVTNAIDAMAAEDGPRILTIASADIDEEVIVSVADTGCGISAEHLAQVFNPLYSTKTQGMGMGLAICRSIVEAHGGRISATTNTPKGAIFRLSLPAQPAATGT